MRKIRSQKRFSDCGRVKRGGLGPSGVMVFSEVAPCAGGHTQIQDGAPDAKSTAGQI